MAKAIALCLHAEEGTPKELADAIRTYLASDENASVYLPALLSENGVDSWVCPDSVQFTACCATFNAKVNHGKITDVSII